MNIREKYGGLRIVGQILQVLAWIALALGIIGAIGAYSSLSSVIPSGGARFGIAIVVLLAFGLTNFFELFVVGGLLGVFTDLESHMRTQNDLLARLAKTSEEAATPPPPPPAP